MKKDPEDLQQERETMEYMADWSVHTLRSELRELIEQCSFSSLQIGAILAASSITKENLRKDVSTIRTLMDRFEDTLDNTFMG